MARCKTCGRNIVWAKTEGGKAMPLDIEAVDGGNVELDLATRVAKVVKPELGMRQFVSHFVTCPQASEHRKR